ncbi:MAG: Ig-like domain-containing protein [Bacteroidales bacterium]|nr:Ig-like domain-containing protein [Candidatus Cryptobacteroides aphodequi]
MKRNNLLPVLASAAIFVPMLFSHSCANTTQAPTGGDKDTIPPALIYAKPYPGAVNVPTSGAKFRFTFDEYVKVKSANNILLSPPSEKAAKTKISGKDVIVWFEEDFEPGRTYSISFTGAISDNNEDNPFPGYAFAFSTGESIDSMLITGIVQDCSSLAPLKDMTVLLYSDLADSAVFLHRPDAVCKTDDWGFFSLPYIADTLYRLYAIKDENNNKIYDPGTELVGFIDSLIRPSMKVNDTIPEMQCFDVKDTLGCQSRTAQYTINVFKERNTKQMISNHGRTAPRVAFLKFAAQDAWIDSLWIPGYRADQLITRFNQEQDSLEIWINDRRRAPDTLRLWVNYRKTDSLGALVPTLENFKLFEEGIGTRKKGRAALKDLKHEDTICVAKFEAVPELVEQEGVNVNFALPIIYEHFDSIRFTYINPKQKELPGTFKVEADTADIRHYILRPDVKLQTGYEYVFKVAHHAFRDINGHYSDSTEVRFKLPTDDALSTLTLDMQGVDRKFIVELLDDKKANVKRRYIIDKPTQLVFPYLKEGKYSIRVTDDGNRNSLVDTGDLLQHRQPEPVRFFKLEDKDYIEIMPSCELTQTIDIPELFK